MITTIPCIDLSTQGSFKLDEVEGTRQMSNLFAD